MATPKVMTYHQVYTAGQNGDVLLAGTVDIKDFSNVDLQVTSVQGVSDPNILVSVTMGKLSGWTLSVLVDRYPLKDWRQKLQGGGARAFDQYR